MKLSKHVNRESKNGKLVWHKGPPPHIWWWNASTSEAITVWRWWDGEVWSVATSSDVNSYDAACSAELRSTLVEIKWNDSYPKNARVPRYDPRG